MTQPSQSSTPEGQGQQEPPRAIPAPRPRPQGPDPVDLYEQHHQHLALAAGFITRYQATREARMDQAALVVALHKAYIDATDRVLRRFSADLDRGAMKPRARRRPRVQVLFGDAPIP